MEKASKEYRLEVAQELQQTFERFSVKVKDAGWKSRKIKVSFSGKQPRRPGGMFLIAPIAYRNGHEYGRPPTKV